MNKKVPVYIGYERDTVAVVSLPRPSDTLLRLRLSLQLCEESWVVQEELLTGLCRVYDVRRLVIDATAQGAAVYDALRSQCPQTEAMYRTREAVVGMRCKAQGLLDKREACAVPLQQLLWAVARDGRTGGVAWAAVMALPVCERLPAAHGGKG